MTPEDRARQAFFDQRSATWLDTFYKDADTGAHDRHQERLRAVIKTLELTPGDHVLDLGCGSGILVPYILEQLGPDGHLSEVDYAPGMITANRQVHTDARISFYCAHVMEMPFDAATFDAVACFACFPHFQDQAGAVQQIARVMKPGARLTIAHLLSSREIVGHHKTETAVSRDCLPPKDQLLAWLDTQGLTVAGFADEPGRYCLTAVKALAGE